MNSGKRGAINELRVAIDLTVNGYDVFRAISQSCSCDLIGYKNNHCYRIEVTTGLYGKRGKLQWPPHDTNLYDVLAVVVWGDEIVYQPTLISLEESYVS